MTYRCIKGFVGEVTMSEGEVRELTEEEAREPMRCGYIEPTEQEVTGNEDVGDKPCRRKGKAKDRL